MVEAKSVTHPITGQAQEYRHLIKGDKKEIWIKSFANELGQIAKGVGNQIDGTNTIFFEKICGTEGQKSDLWTSRL